MSWPTVALREVADIERNSVRPENIATGTRYLGLEHVESGGRIISSESVDNGDLASSKFSFGPRHILYGKLRPYLAKIALPDFEGVCSTDILPVLPSERIEKNYLAHFLRQTSMVDYANNLSTGANLPRLSPKSLAEFPIPLPPLEEQKRIAGILDQADALRRLRTRALDKLNTLGQAIFHEMFGDPTQANGLKSVTLGDCAHFFSGNTLPIGEGHTDQQDGYLILKVSDLNHPENSREIVAAAQWSNVAGSKAATCPAGAIVFPKRGGAIGTNKKRILKRPAILDPNLMGVVPIQNLMTTDFISGWFAQFNLSDIASGSSVPQLNKKDLAPLPLYLPKMSDQIRYGQRMKGLEDIRNRVVSAYNEQEALFASLQHRAFRGEL